MLRVVRSVKFEFLCELVKRVLKKKQNVRLFFTSRNPTIDSVLLQSAVPVVHRKLSLQRWVTYNNELICRQWFTLEFSSGEGGGSTNSVEDRGRRERGSGGGSPLVRGSAQFANE
jgi:hypothetical protein